MRKFLISDIFTVIFSLLVLPAIYADTGSDSSFLILNSNFLPPKSYVGDVVELRMVIKTLNGKKPAAPARYKSSDSLQIKNIRVVGHSANQFTLHIYFVSYQTGTQLLPVIESGDIRLDNIQIYTSSLLNELTNARFRGVKGQVILPGTNIKIAAVILLILLLPFVIIFLIIKVKSWIKILKRERKRKRPYRVIILGLKKLNERLDQIKVKEFFIEASADIKKYMEERLGMPFLSLTTEEIKKQLIKEMDDTSLVSELVDILHRSDLVKFGGKRMKRSDMEIYLKRITVLIKGIETLLENADNVEL
ncbi:MAG: hypothetical protein GXP33_08170 [Spirochaetes bacterium]|nr:hypothetical protein [Spirochaetota bacterium]